ncbi:MAG: phosphoglycolate phosphatase [Parvibaculales bacterium]
MTYPFALLFDLDGTLAETAPDLCAAMNHVLQQHGLQTVPTERVRDMIGGGARMILQRGLAHNGVHWPDERLDAATEELVAYYAAHICDQTYLYDGVQDCLAAAKAAGVRCAVVTNKRYGLASRLLAALDIDGSFDVIIGGDTLPTRKPDPEMLEEAATRLGVAIENCIMIGDSEADTEAAKAAGMPCICVDFGYRRVAADQLGADQLISGYQEIYRAIETCLPGLKITPST